MAARQRSQRSERQRRLGQNFLRPKPADRFVAEANFKPDQLVLEIGPGAGAITLELLKRQIDVVAIELDAVWALKLRARAGKIHSHRLRVVEADFLSFRLPKEPFRVVGSLPFGQTSAILSHILDDPTAPLTRADLIVQWEVARKRASQPPNTLRSTAWAPWWCFHLGRRVPAREFAPIPRVDGGVLSITRRIPALLPSEMSKSYEQFVRSRWPFRRKSSRS